jgi:protein-S-isoprenylcysteine O-methyltransferase Ste14/rhodanese-related sulfurtransferase
VPGLNSHNTQEVTVITEKAANSWTRRLEWLEESRFPTILAYALVLAVIAAIGFDTRFTFREPETYELIVVIALAVPAVFLCIFSLFGLISYFVFIPSISSDGHLFSRVHGTHLLHPLTTSLLLGLLALCILTGSGAAFGVWSLLLVAYCFQTYLILRRLRQEHLVNGSEGIGTNTMFLLLNLIIGGELVTVAAGAKPLSPWRLNVLPQDTWIVDVRTKPEFHWNRMNASQNFPWGAGVIEAAKSVPKDRPVLVTCFSGHRSPAVAVMMRKLGFKTVYNLNWGLLYLILLERGRTTEGPFGLTRAHRDANRRGEDVKGISAGYIALSVMTLIVAPLESHLWPPENSALREIIGGLIGLGGLLIGLLSFRALGRNFRVFAAPRRSGTLITTGIYTKVRHPMYTSVIMAIGGYALLFGSWISLPLWLGVAILYIIKSVKEERLLEQKFPEYADYRARTWRLVPFVW